MIAHIQEFLILVEYFQILAMIFALANHRVISLFPMINFYLI